MQKRSIKRNTLYKLQRKKEGKWCLKVYAHHILVYSPHNCHMHHVECELKKLSAPSKNQKNKIWPTILVRLHFLCINCWIKRVVKKKWSSWRDSRRSPLRIVGCRRPPPTVIIKIIVSSSPALISDIIPYVGRRNGTERNSYGTELN